MGFFTKREREELDKLPHVNDRGTEFVHQHEVHETDDELIENDLSSMLQGAAWASLREVDTVISDLEVMRETLRSEASRIQREMAEYATFSQSAAQSSKVICDSLRTGLRPLQHKGRKEKRRAKAQRKAAIRAAKAAMRAQSSVSFEKRELAD